MNRKEARSVLGVSASATDSEIKTAYRELVKEYHPDHCDAPDAQQKFLQVKEAKNTLENSPSGTSQQTATKNGQTASTSTDWRDTSGTNQQSAQQSTQQWSYSTSTNSSWRTERETRYTSATTNERQTTEAASSQSTHSGYQTQSSSTKTTSASTSNVSQSASLLDSVSGILYALKHNYTSRKRRNWYRSENIDTGQPPNRNPLLKLIVFYLLCVTDSFRPNQPTHLRAVEINPVADLLSTTISAPDKLHGFCTNALRTYALFSIVLGSGTAVSIAVLSGSYSWNSLATIAFVSSFVAAAVATIVSDSKRGYLPNIVAPYHRELYSWSPLGSLLVLGIFWAYFEFATLFVDLLLIPSLRLFPILLLFSLPTIAVMTLLIEKIPLLPSRGFQTPYPNAIAIGTGMFLTGIIVHSGPFGSLMPGYFVGLEEMYYGHGGVEIDGILISIGSTAWLCFIIPALDAADIGWNRVHRDWEHSHIVRGITSGTISGILAVVIWTLLPTVAPPNDIISAFEYLLVVLFVYLYTYGILTQPDHAPKWS